MRRGFLIAHVETADSDPSLKLTALGEVGKFTHLLGIVAMGGRDLKAGRVDESKGVEKMGEACCVELLGGLGVTFTCTHIPRLVVTNGSAVGAAAALCAGGRGGDIAGSVAGLTGKGLVDGVGIVTEDFSGLRYKSQYETARQYENEEMELTPHQPEVEQQRFIPQGISPSSLYSPHIALASQLEEHPLPQ